MHSPRAPRDIVPVVSLLLYKDASRAEVLLGVRRSSLNSPRHPDVLSTPTMRVPYSFMAQVLTAQQVAICDAAPPTFVAISDPGKCPIGVPYSLASPGAFLVEALMCRKLGLGSAIVSGEFSGVLSMEALAFDLVHDDHDGYEQTLMLTYGCVPTRGASAVPSASAAYSRMDWVDASLVDAATRSKDPQLLLPDASPIEVCIHGLCVRSAAFVLTLQ